MYNPERSTSRALPLVVSIQVEFVTVSLVVTVRYSASQPADTQLNSSTFLIFRTHQGRQWTITGKAIYTEHQWFQGVRQFSTKENTVCQQMRQMMATNKEAESSSNSRMQPDRPCIAPDSIQTAYRTWWLPSGCAMKMQTPAMILIQEDTRGWTDRQMLIMTMILTMMMTVTMLAAVINVDKKQW